MNEMLIENYVGAQLPFSFFSLPFSLLLFFLLLCPRLLPATAKESGGLLKLFSSKVRKSSSQVS